MHKDYVFGKDKENFRVVEISNLRIENYIHPDYKIETETHGKLSETGLVVLFQITPVFDGSKPYFVARWDQNFGTLDIDIKNVAKDVETLFKAEKGGYRGHHPIRILDETRTYDVNVQLPEKSIFRGNVTFNIGHGHHPHLFQ